MSQLIRVATRNDVTTTMRVVIITHVPAMSYADALGYNRDLLWRKTRNKG